MTALVTLLLPAVFDRSSGTIEAPCPFGAPAEVDYAPAENLEAIDVALLRELRRQIDMGPTC